MATNEKKRPRVYRIYSDSAQPTDTEQDVSALKLKMNSIAGPFAATESYNAGEYVWYNNVLYVFTADHAAGSWTGSDAEQVVLTEEMTDQITELKTDLDDVNDELFIISNPKNLWESPDTAYTSTGVTYSKSGEEYSFTIGTAGSNKGAFFTGIADVSALIGQSVTISAILKSKTVAGTPTIRPNFMDANDSPIYGSTTYQFTLNTSARTSKTLVVPEGAVRMVAGFYSGSTSSEVNTTWTVENVQIEVGTSATNYEPPGQVSRKVSVLDGVKANVASNTDEIGTVKIHDLLNDKFFCGGRIRKCINPYKNGGSQQLKGQLHCHRTDNEGTVLSTVQQIFDNYKTLYDFMALTDYGFTADLSDYNSLVELNEAQSDYNLIQLFKGYEAKIVGGNGVKQYHMIVWSPAVIETFDAGTPPQTVIDALTADGCICDFPHLTYSNYTAADMTGINVRYTEVVNGSSLSETQWDALLTNGVITYGLGVSDCHGTGSAIEAAYIWLFANQKNKGNIFESLEDGNFYASDGAKLSSVTVSDGVYTVDAGGSATIVFSKEGGTVVKTVTGSSGSYTFDGTEKYVRAKVTDANSKCAWTQPVIFADEEINL